MSTRTSPETETPYRPPVSSRRRGVVKWFNDAKGFGFIAPEDGGKDIFVHFSGINGKGHRQLEENQEVAFDVETGDKGPFATNVDVVSS